MGAEPSTDTRGDRAPWVGSITYRARPVSLNRSYGHSRYERTSHVREWRDTFTLLAKEAKIPRMDAIHVTVEAGMSGVLQDIGNCYVSAKAAIDGLVNAKVIPKDTGDHLHSLTFLPVVRITPKEHDYMTLHIAEVGASEHKRIVGALKSTIVAHGPITLDWIGSAAKRIQGALRP